MAKAPNKPEEKAHKDAENLILHQTSEASDIRSSKILALRSNQMYQTAAKQHLQRNLGFFLLPLRHQSTHKKSYHENGRAPITPNSIKTLSHMLRANWQCKSKWLLDLKSSLQRMHHDGEIERKGLLLWDKSQVFTLFQAASHEKSLTFGGIPTFQISS